MHSMACCHSWNKILLLTDVQSHMSWNIHSRKSPRKKQIKMSLTRSAAAGGSFCRCYFIFVVFVVVVAVVVIIVILIVAVVVDLISINRSIPSLVNCLIDLSASI